MPKVSIIVPVYKVESYLRRCVESLRVQTLSDLEIILVDDGSPDCCPEICDAYSRLDARIITVHKENGGLSSARNAGIKIATGQYIGYVDSDDYVAPDMFQILYDCAVKHQVDFVMEDYRKAYPNGTCVPWTLDIRAGLYNKEDIFNEIFPMLIMRRNVEYGPLLSVWHCLYRTDFVKSLHFFDEEIKWSEDCIYSAMMGYHAESFYYLKNTYGYYYCQNAGTISRSFKPDAWRVYCLMNEKLRSFFETKEEYDFSNQLNVHMLYFACSFLGQLKYAGYGFRKTFSVYKTVLRDPHLIQSLKNVRIEGVTWKFRIYVFLVKIRASLLLTIWEKYHE